MKRKIRKPNKYCKLYGIEIRFEKELNDAEVRLYHLYLRIVDWDSKHKDTFGSSDMTVRELRRYCLPNWAIGKICYTQRSLIKKKWLERRIDGRVAIRSYEMYRQRSVHIAEQLVQLTRQGVQQNEQPVQQDEKGQEKRRIGIEREIKELAAQKRVFVQPIEQPPTTKET